MSAAANATSGTPRLRGLHLALWITQLGLAAAFGAAGYLNVTHSTPGIVATMGGVSVSLVRLVGYVELAGAVAMIHPSLLRIAPQITPLAAAALALMETLAMPINLVLGKVFLLPMNLALMAMAVFVAWGRWRKVPIPSRLRAVRSTT